MHKQRHGFAPKDQKKNPETKKCVLVAGIVVQ
jgi:hypothetical protein